MCRWGCPTVDTTYKCKWCGTRFCRDCLRGDFSGCMWEPNRCRVCNQVKCVGERVEYVERPKQPVVVTKGSSPSAKSRAKSSRSIKSTKSAKSTKSSRKSGKSSKSAKKKKVKKKK